MTDPGRRLRMACGQRRPTRSAASPSGPRARPATSRRRSAVLLLPRELESFILRDQAEDLLTAPGRRGRRARPRALRRLPAAAGRRSPTASRRRQARRLRLPGIPRAIVIFHPLQYPLARGLIAQHPDAELWYWRWDRYEVAYDASPRQRDAAGGPAPRRDLRAALTVVVSDALGRRRPRGGRRRRCWCRSPPTPSRRPTPGATVVAVSLGHLGHRTDWTLLRALAERHARARPAADRRVARAASPAATRTSRRAARAPNLVWLGRRSDEEAARLILLRRRRASCPFERSEFNDTALPLPDPQVRAAGPPDGLARTSRACARGTARCTIADVARRVGRGAARAGRRARAAGRRAARVGAGADRARAEPAAVGAAGGAGDRERAARLRARQQRAIRARSAVPRDAARSRRRAG